MFNIQGSEVIIILLLALVVLGPEKLPEAMRRAGQMYGELKKMSSSFQQEFRSVVDEPMREMRSTADLLRDSADFTKLSKGERDEKPTSATMGSPGDLAPADPDAEPTEDIPFAGRGGDIAATTASEPVATEPVADAPAADAPAAGTRPGARKPPNAPFASSADIHPPTDSAGEQLGEHRPSGAVDDPFGSTTERPVRRGEDGLRESGPAT